MALTKTDFQAIGVLLNKQRKAINTDIADFISDTVLPQIGELQTGLAGVQATVDRMEKKLDDHDDRMDRHGKTLDTHETRISRLEKKKPINLN